MIEIDEGFIANYISANLVSNGAFQVMEHYFRITFCFKCILLKQRGIHLLLFNFMPLLVSQTYYLKSRYDCFIHNRSSEFNIMVCCETKHNFKDNFKTRKHSSRMRTANSETVFASKFQWPPPDVPPGGPLIDKFELVSSGYQMSLAGWSPGLMYEGMGSQDLISGGGGLSYLTFPGGVPTMWTIPWCIWCYLHNIDAIRKLKRSFDDGP